MTRHNNINGIVVPLTPEEEAELDARIAAFQAKRLEELPDEIRAERVRLLAQTDWTQAGDVPEATKLKWAEYRQALRDITKQAGFPTDITWPVKPT